MHTRKYYPALSWVIPFVWYQHTLFCLYQKKNCFNYWNKLTIIIIQFQYNETHCCSLLVVDCNVYSLFLLWFQWYHSFRWSIRHVPVVEFPLYVSSYRFLAQTWCANNWVRRMLGVVVRPWYAFPLFLCTYGRLVDSFSFFRSVSYKFYRWIIQPAEMIGAGAKRRQWPTMKYYSLSDIAKLALVCILLAATY